MNFRVVNLAARPQVNLRSVGRRRFAHLSDAGDEIQVDANIPWGSTTLFTLEFREDSRYYAIHTSNNRYLSRDGRLVEEVSATCLFSLEYHAGNIALRDTAGLYLAPLGSKVLTTLYHHPRIISISLFTMYIATRAPTRNSFQNFYLSRAYENFKSTKTLLGLFDMIEDSIIQNENLKNVGLFRIIEHFEGLFDIFLGLWTVLSRLGDYWTFFF